MAKYRDCGDEGHFDSSIADGVVKVGDGRGFVAECQGRRAVITAAHCLPFLPPPFRFSYTEERTYENLLGTLEAGNPSVWAECLFADPVADVAILGSPDGQVLFDEAEAYMSLTDERLAFQIGDPPNSGRAWMLGLDGNWYSCPMEWLFPGSVIIDGETKPGMSGSPIISDDGSAIALVADGVESVDVDGVRRAEKSSQPALSYALPRWSLMAQWYRTASDYLNQEGVVHV